MLFENMQSLGKYCQKILAAREFGIGTRTGGHRNRQIRGTGARGHGGATTWRPSPATRRR